MSVKVMVDDMLARYRQHLERVFFVGAEHSDLEYLRGEIITLIAKAIDDDRRHIE